MCFWRIAMKVSFKPYPWLYGVNAFEDACSAMLLVVMLTLIMQYSRKHYAGTIHLSGFNYGDRQRRAVFGQRCGRRCIRLLFLFNRDLCSPRFYVLAQSFLEKIRWHDGLLRLQNCSQLSSIGNNFIFSRFFKHAIQLI